MSVVSSIWGISATKGALLKARRELEFTERGKEILELKRDRLAGEINTLLPKLRERNKLEERILGLYEDFKVILMLYGVDSLISYSKALTEPKVKFLPKSIIGVLVPYIKIEREASIENISDPLIQIFSKKLSKLFKELLDLAVAEVKVERLALEMMDTNRKVNALEKIIIPQYKELIRYLEERILEEELQEFVRTKYIATKGKMR